MVYFYFANCFKSSLILNWAFTIYVQDHKVCIVIRSTPKPLPASFKLYTLASNIKRYNNDLTGTEKIS